MWVSVRLDASTGQWVKVAQHESLAECRVRAESRDAEDSPAYFFLMEAVHTRADANRVIDEVAVANHGRITRVTVGLDFSAVTRSDALTGCAGDSVCVVRDGYRRCEAYFCNGAICWWVPCGIGC